MQSHHSNCVDSRQALKKEADVLTVYMHYSALECLFEGDVSFFNIKTQFNIADYFL